MKICEQHISRVQSTKSLGVVFDQRQVWEEHVDSLCKRVFSGLAALKQARQYVPLGTLLTIYNALIKPLFDYCDVVWGNLNKPLTARLQKLPNRAARIITRKGNDVRSADISKELRWDDLKTIRKKHLAIVIYKVVNNKALGYLINQRTINDPSTISPRHTTVESRPHVQTEPDNFACTIGPNLRQHKLVCYRVLFLYKPIPNRKTE